MGTLKSGLYKEDNMKMKKLCAFVAAGMLALSLVACTDGNEPAKTAFTILKHIPLFYNDRTPQKAQGQFLMVLDILLYRIKK